MDKLSKIEFVQKKEKMEFLKVPLYAVFIIPSSIEAERGNEIKYRKVPPCFSKEQYISDMDAVMNTVSKIKNQNFLNDQLSRVPNAVRKDGVFIHISDSMVVEIEEE